ncbi:MAG TPA: hypothetical protein PJ990_14920 [Saprospiraceae bacterium]|nr:hypothetical protein [Saprospiraceae bacterium]
MKTFLKIIIFLSCFIACKEKQVPVQVDQECEKHFAEYPLDMELLGPFEYDRASEMIDSLVLLSEFQEPKSGFPYKEWKDKYYIVKLTNVSPKDTLNIGVYSINNHFDLKWALFRRDSIGYLRNCAGIIMISEYDQNGKLIPGTISYHIADTGRYLTVAEEGDLVIFHGMEIESKFFDELNLSEENSQKRFRHPIFAYVKRKNRLERVDFCTLDLENELKKTEEFYTGKDALKEKANRPCYSSPEEIEGEKIN